MAHHAVPIHDQIMMPTPHTPPHITSYGEFPHSSVLTVFYKVVVAAAVSRTSIQEITIINFENQLVCLVCLSSLVPVSSTKFNHRRVNPNYEGTPVWLKPTMAASRPKKVKAQGTIQSCAK